MRRQRKQSILRANNVNLIDSWLRGFAELDRGNGDHKPVVSAIDDMNFALKTRYTLSRIGEWRRGKRAIPAKVRKYMMMYALPQVMQDECGKTVFGLVVGDPIRFQRILDKLT